MIIEAYFKIVVSAQGREYLPGNSPDKIFQEINKLVLEFMNKGIPYNNAIARAHKKYCINEKCHCKSESRNTNKKPTKNLELDF